MPIIAKLYDIRILLFEIIIGKEIFFDTKIQNLNYSPKTKSKGSGVVNRKVQEVGQVERISRIEVFSKLSLVVAVDKYL